MINPCEYPTNQERFPLHGATWSLPCGRPALERGECLDGQVRDLCSGHIHFLKPESRETS